MFRFLIAAVLCACMAAGAGAAVRGDDIMYVGGTLSTVPEKTEGKIDLSRSDQAVFTSKKHSILLPYSGIASIEYGQKAGRRLGVAIAVSPVALLSKKRRHYVSISFTDASGTRQGAVFEIAKGLVASMIRTLEQRSGKTVDFESAEARTHFEKEAK